MSLVDRISFEVANCICRALLPLGDEAWTLTQQATDRGFRAYTPYNEFVESFGDADDIELHRICIKESIKAKLGRPWPFRLTASQASQVYFSKIISDLRNNLYEMHGVKSEREMNAKYPNNIEFNIVDPCERKKILSARANGVDFELRREAIYNRVGEIVAAEEKREAKYAINMSSFNERRRLGFLKTLLSEHARPFGFDYSRLQSKSTYLVFSKPVAENWSLCIVLEGANNINRNALSGLYEPKLMLRHNSIKGDPDRDSLERFLTFDYASVIFGFSSSYWKFHDFEELELHIAAHLFLYGLCHEVIERAVQGAF